MDCEGMELKINLLYKQKKYKDTEDKIYELLDYINNKKSISTIDKTIMYHCYIKLANIERRKENYKTAIKIARLALLYSNIETEKYQCFHIMGICYKYLNKIPIATEYYDKCINFYSRIEDINVLVKVLKCKALMLHDERLLQDAIDLLKKSNDLDLALYKDFIKTLEEIKIYNNCDNSKNISTVISFDTYKALRNKTDK